MTDVGPRDLVDLPRWFPVADGLPALAEGAVWAVADAEGHPAARVTAQGGGWWLIETAAGAGLARCDGDAPSLLTLDAVERATLDLHHSGGGGVVHVDGQDWEVSPTTAAVSTITVSRLGVEVLRLRVDREPHEVRQVGVLPPEVVLFLVLVAALRRPRR